MNTVSVISSGAFAPALKELVPIFQQKTHIEIELILSSMGSAQDSIPNRLKRGETFDVYILANNAIDKYIQEGYFQKGSRVDIAGSTMVAAVKKGKVIPQLNTVESFKNSLLQSKHIAYSASASGNYLAKEVFEQLQITAEMKAIAHQISNEKIGTVVSRGDTEIGFQQYSELLPFKDLDIIRDLPPEIQKTFYFSAALGIHPKNELLAKDFIRFLASKESQPVINHVGLDAILPDLSW